MIYLFYFMWFIVGFTVGFGLALYGAYRLINQREARQLQGYKDHLTKKKYDLKSLHL